MVMYPKTHSNGFERKKVILGKCRGVAAIFTTLSSFLSHNDGDDVVAVLTSCLLHVV